MTIVRMYGVTGKGNSAVAYIYNFRPYFFIQLAFNQIVEASHLPELKRYLNVSEPLFTPTPRANLPTPTA